MNDECDEHNEGYKFIYMMKSEWVCQRVIWKENVTDGNEFKAFEKEKEGTLRWYFLHIILSHYTTNIIYEKNTKNITKSPHFF